MELNEILEKLIDFRNLCKVHALSIGFSFFLKRMLSNSLN